MSAMVNLIGELPDVARLLRVPGAHVHLYDKSPRPARKLGHVTVTAPDATELATRLKALDAIVADPATHA
jgi:5-(carboxyamino)imidazole ribonucleotide synthase